MGISVWYVYLDESNEWLVNSESGEASDNWRDAEEFFDPQAADCAADKAGGVVFGWCQ